MSKCCTNCFTEPHIQSFIEDADQCGTCNYCGSANVSIRDVDNVGSFVCDGIDRYYEDAANQVSYVSAEGGYQMPTCSISEILLYELMVFSDAIVNPQQLLDDLIDDDGTPYVRKDPYGPPSGQPDEIYKWRRFSEIVMSQQRFTAFHRSSGTLHDDGHPSIFMQHLADYLNSTNLMRTINPGIVIYRARIMQEHDRFSHKDLSSPLPKRTRNNRMSPAGISLFYGCLDSDTCIAEVRPSVGDHVAVAKFTVLRSLRILDISQPVEEPISIFNEDYFFENEVYFKPFLRHFAGDIAKPIRRDEADILYVPTQAFTEFIRVHAFHAPLSEDGIEQSFHIDGLMFRSSLQNGGKNIVLFRGPDISTTRIVNSEHAWLRYDRYHVYELNGITYSARRIISA